MAYLNCHVFIINTVEPHLAHVPEQVPLAALRLGLKHRRLHGAKVDIERGTLHVRASSLAIACACASAAQNRAPTGLLRPQGANKPEAGQRATQYLRAP